MVSLGNRPCHKLRADAVDPENICRFLAIVTGFGVKLAARQDPNQQPPLTLCVRTPIPIPRTALVALEDKVDCNQEGATLFVKLRPRSEGALQPRDLLDLLRPYDPILQDTATDEVEARVNADLKAVAWRTVVCGLLTIPVLVFAWSPLQFRSTLVYPTISLVLSSIVMIFGWPIYRSSFTLLWYVHAIDLGMLASVSIISAYVFSVISYAFEMAGNKFADSLFETVGLLVTLIFLGRTVQVYTRRLACSMLKGLSSLQPRSAKVVYAAGAPAEVIDVR